MAAGSSTRRTTTASVTSRFRKPLLAAGMPARTVLPGTGGLLTHTGHWPAYVRWRTVPLVTGCHSLPGNDKDP